MLINNAIMLLHGYLCGVQHCVKAGSRVVAMTNTENAGSGSSPRDADRQRLNNMIREWVARHGSQPNGPLLVDLGEHSECRFEPEPFEAAELLTGVCMRWNHGHSLHWWCSKWHGA